MSRPEEFTIRIEPDGRIVLDAGELQESSYRRILELLAETVGPVQPLDAEQADPPRRFIRDSRTRQAEQSSSPFDLKLGHTSGESSAE